MSNDAQHTYGATHLQGLTEWEAIRTRPWMYIGSVTERGLHQMVFEVADRAVNEVPAGRAGSVDVALTPDGDVRVADDGPGGPFASGQDTGGPGLEALLTRTHAGAHPGGRHAVSTGAAGTWLCVTNILSSRLTAEVRHDGVRRLQDYVRGVPLAPPHAAGPATGTGTVITFRPDTSIFGAAKCSFAALAERFKELAYLNRGLDISLTDGRASDGSRSERFRFPGGARDLVAHLDAEAAAGAPVHPDVIGFEREDPRMAGTMEVALRWHDSPEERVRSYANSRPTSEGGSHTAGFRDGVTAAVNRYARDRRLLTATDPGLDAATTSEGLTAVVSVKLDHPEFEGSTRGKLANAAVPACVGEAVREHVGAWLEEHPERAEAVVGRIIHQG
ncbi:DNA gyrase subunit B [Streptomyces sp. I05A-00742]|uniref:DNA gyrase subunit B n=1 Tax=Streptomyces sp. I05A-00742 TaxID=2732853 RepID=UPI001488E69D|nr:DNA gyrase subunit B [Streptomyces sp. I05A-00742]